MSRLALAFGLRNTHARTPRSYALPRSFVRPVLETLESRCLLSWTVDSAFGNVQVTDFEGYVKAAAVQPDGKIVLVDHHVPVDGQCAVS